MTKGASKRRWNKKEETKKLNDYGKKLYKVYKKIQKKKAKVKNNGNEKSKR